jgi:hypothetical protein
MDSFRKNGLLVFETVLEAGAIEAAKRYHSTESGIVVFQGSPTNAVLRFDVVEASQWGFSGYILTDGIHIDITRLEKILPKLHKEKKAGRITRAVLDVFQGETISAVRVGKAQKPILAGSVKPVVLELEYHHLLIFLM